MLIRNQDDIAVSSRSFDFNAYVDKLEELYASGDEGAESLEDKALLRDVKIGNKLSKSKIYKLLKTFHSKFTKAMFTEF
jgi:hypothetical protein